MTREEAKRIYIEEKAYKRGYEDAKKELDRPHGEWIPQDKFSAYYKCSNCGIMIDNDFPIWRNFCPNCGADMREEGDPNEQNV